MMNKIEKLMPVAIAIVLTAAFGTFAYLSLAFHNEIKELEELNESMRIQLVEKDARIEHLEGYITTLEDDR